MSSSTIFFGARPSRNQVVAEAVKAKGLNLLRQSPFEVTFSGFPTAIQPGFAVYHKYIATYMAVALDPDYADQDSPFHNIPAIRPELDQLPIDLPDLVISWNVTIPDETREELRKIGFKDTTVRGKPAMFKAKPTGSDVRKALETKALETSPTPQDKINIFSYRRCLLLRKLVSHFFRVHQYPAFIDDDHSEEFSSKVHYSKKSEDPTFNVDDDGDDDMEDTTDTMTKYRFRIILPTPAVQAPVFYTDRTAPQGAGLLFPYVPELAQYDRYTVPEVVKRHFYACLGEDERDAREEWNDLVSAWGNIFNSEFGNIMSHIFKVIDISFQVQACPHVILTAGVYDGMFMRGGGYELKINDTEYIAASAETIARDIQNMDWHNNALWQIFNRISFQTDDDRRTQLEATKRVGDIWKILQSLSIQGGTGVRDTILENAKYLNFPDDRRLEPTAYNISMVLDYISDTSKDILTLPFMHPSCLFSSDRIELALSAFGDVAPSFRVPGGRTMILTSEFKVPDTSSGARPGDKKFVTRIAARMVPIEVAVKDLKATISDKCVLNPFGNKIINRSASHIYKEFEKDSCSMLVEGLRRVAKVTVDTGIGGSKRRIEGEEDHRPRKKGRASDMLD